ncbi:MAG: putative quinol monooxygenase [Bryobacteraceae bacterium]
MIEEGIDTRNRDKEPDVQQVVLINVFTPKPGKLDELIAFQAEELRRFMRECGFPGWLGSRGHRSIDGSKAVNVTVYDSIEAHDVLKERVDFSQHRRKIEDLVESVEGGFYTVVESVRRP